MMMMIMVMNRMTMMMMMILMILMEIAILEELRSLPLKLYQFDEDISQKSLEDDDDAYDDDVDGSNNHIIMTG